MAILFIGGISRSLVLTEALGAFVTTRAARRRYRTSTPQSAMGEMSRRIQATKMTKTEANKVERLAFTDDDQPLAEVVPLCQGQPRSRHAKAGRTNGGTEHAPARLGQCWQGDLG